jgi:hypothetical protein
MLLSIVAACVIATFGQRVHAANSLGLAYSSVVGVEQYAHPTGAVISGRCNFNDPAFQRVRDGGGEHYDYFSPTDIRVSGGGPHQGAWCPEELAFYAGAYGNDWSKVPRWRYGGVERSVWPRTVVADLSLNHAYARHIIDGIVARARLGRSDGCLLDVVGPRMWGKVWADMTQFERDTWTRVTLEFLRALRLALDQEAPNYKLVANNIFDDADPVLRARYRTGEQYIDGVMIEHHSPDAHKLAIAARPYRGIPYMRRVFVIGKTKADNAGWIAAPGVTHYSDAFNDRPDPYARVRPPIAGFQPLPLPPPPLSPEVAMEVATGLHIHGVQPAIDVVQQEFQDRDALARVSK